MDVTTLAPKDPDVAATYSIDWSRQLVLDVKRSTSYVLGAIVRPTRWAGFYWEVTTAGDTGQQVPSKTPRAAGETLADGSVVWTARHPSSVSIPTVSTAVWTIPSGLTLSSQLEDTAATHVTLTGGVDGADYEITCRMTPTTGNPLDQTVIIPVRRL